MGVDDVCGSAGGKETPDVDRVDPIESDDVGRGLADQPRDAGLAIRVTNNLRQGGGRDRHTAVRLERTGEQHDHSPGVAI